MRAVANGSDRNREAESVSTSAPQFVLDGAQIGACSDPSDWWEYGCGVNALSGEG